MSKSLIDKLKDILDIKTTEVELTTEVLLEDEVTDETPSTDAPVEEDPTGATLEEVIAIVDDLQVRVTNLEALLVEAKSVTEKLSKVVDVIKNEPSGSPITKMDVISENKTNSNEDKLKAFGKNLKK